MVIMSGTTELDSSPSLAAMVLEGAANLEVRFGVEGQPVSAAALLDGGRHRFSSAAEGTTVAVLMTNDQPTVEVLVGAIEAGCRVVSLPVPSRSADLGTYLEFITGACRSQGATEVVARHDIAELLAAGGVPARSHQDLEGRPLAAAGGGFELVQFSSGSTASPKAVLLDDRSLGTNVAAIMTVLQPTRGDRSVSWLPLSHDMGLIGMLFTSLASARPGFAEQAELILLDPVDFLRRPELWIEALGQGGTITAAPDFGYRLCVERAGIGPADLADVRIAIVGGETIRATTLQHFSARFADDRFRPEAFCPAYGLAEIGLAATVDPVGEHWRQFEVDASALADLRFTPRSVATRCETATPVTLVSSGSTIPGYEVRSTSESGYLGAIEVRGPSSGIDGSTGLSFADEAGWVRTGDLGIVIDGQLVVSGRGDDHIVTAGRNVYAPAVEDAIGRVTGVRAGRVAVLGLASGEWVVVAEPTGIAGSPAVDPGELRRRIGLAAVAVASSRPAEIVMVPRGRLPMTPSGKLQRREALRRFVDDAW
jgi:fatty-acyl-CoA synthase